jgi:proton-translocating NADH-quinone oxidoreductase chain L
MYLLIIFLPLMGSLSAGLFGHKIGPYGATRITTFCILLTCFFSYISFFDVALANNPVYIQVATWINSGIFDISWGFMFDTLTVLMLIVVTTVSLIVHLYSIGYMEADPHIPRFFSYLSLFTFFMLILVTADNLVQMFVGWEGVGLCSYLLINFWHTRLQANKAAIKAVIVNRVGDFGLVLGMLGTFYVFKTFNYSVLFSLVPFYASEINEMFNILGFEVNILTFICIFFFVGAVGKSAQLGLHTWLPDAMEGPTPVSALIHAATMVTAGVFLIARCSPLFEYSPFALLIVTCFGAMTAFFAATTALVQNDLKRVIAYSTCSQLGYMVFACGTSNYSVGVFHLANHAFFKALLFLSAGSVIHALGDEQDMRKMGGLIKLIPFTYAMMFIGSISLMGFPFLTGFYSKDAILELAFGKFTVSSHFAFWLGAVSASLTSFYSMRLLYLTFLKKTNSYRYSIQHVHDLPKIMGYPLFILVFGSIFIGYLTRDMIIGVGTNFWGNALFVLPENLIIFDAEFLPVYIKLIPVIFSFLGFLLAYLFYVVLSPRFLYSLKQKSLVIFFYNFFNRKWFFDKVYNEFINQIVLNLGYYKTYKLLDRGVIEKLGPFGLMNFFYNNALKINFLQTGLIYHSALVMLIGIISLFMVVGFFSFFNVFFNIYLINIFIVLIFFIVYIDNKYNIKL